MITKYFIITKDFYTYSIKILRQEKMLRDHRPECPIPREARDLWSSCAREAALKPPKRTNWQSIATARHEKTVMAQQVAGPSPLGEKLVEG
jgi:hypothetical protein